MGGAPPNWSVPPFKDAPISAYKTGLYYQYMPNPKTYVCLLDAKSKDYSKRANKMSTYIMNGAVCGYSSSPFRSAKITQVWSPMCYIQWEPDENLGTPPIGAFAYNDASSYPDQNEGVGRLHTKGAIILAVGGHVQFISFQDFEAEKKRNKGFLWWSPWSATGR